MTEHLTDVDVLADAHAIHCAAEVGMSCDCDVPDAIEELKRELASVQEQYTNYHDWATDEIQRLRTALAGVSTCSTCEACRGAALRALGAPVTTGDGAK